MKETINILELDSIIKQLDKSYKNLKELSNIVSCKNKETEYLRSAITECEKAIKYRTFKLEFYKLYEN